MDLFRIKKSDTKPYLTVTLQDSDGVAINLTGSSIQFNLGNASDYTNVHSAAAVITDAVNGQCEYRWNGTSDTVTPGLFFGEFQITFSDGKIMTLPNNHSLSIEIYEDYD